MAIETRRRQIEDAASELFRTNGYAATSVRDIARALDLQGASLYAHVAGKEDVLWAIVDRAASRFEEALARAEAEADANDATAAERLRAIVAEHARLVARAPELAAVFATEWRYLSGERRASILARRDAYEARVREVIANGMATGELALTDGPVAAAFLLSALNGIAAWFRPDGRLSPDDLADRYADLAIRALSEDSR
ncbi:MAG TPA: TetR/AcrR family transcriptional regulator [Candidatus Limnocylindrales bacterium]|nr:TetR/AcrR family transcriptional regulator [Candidatus Limnocylindrales bacterium]